MLYLGFYLCRLSPLSIGSDCNRSTEVRKSHKYEGLCDRYIFQAIAIEFSDVLGRDTDAFISWLGHLTTPISDKRLLAELLGQRLLLATVRGNA